MNVWNQLETGDYLVIILYVAGMALIGALASRKIKDAKDFSSAGQSLPWYLAAGSTIATCMGANMVLGKYDLIYQAGMSGLTASLFWWLGWIFLLLMAGRLRKSGAVSIPSFLEKRYNSRTQKYSSVCVLLMTISSCAAQFLSVGTICEALGICSRETGVWVGAALIILFTIFSGLWGVTITDTIQSVILMIAFGIVFPVLVFRQAGGWQAIVDYNTRISPDRMDLFAGIAPVTMLGWAAYYILCTGADPSFSQRIFSAKNMKSALLGQIAAWIPTLLICGFLSALPGLAIGKIFPDISYGSEFTPLFLVTYVPPIVRGLMLASLLGLMLTSGDTYLLLLASTVTDDLVRPRKPDMKEKQLLFVNRLVCVLSAVVICAMALYVDSIYQLLKTGGGAYGAGVFVPLLLGCFWKKARASAINAGILAGGFCSFCFDMFLKIPLGLDMDGVLLGAAVCLVCCVGGSLMPEKCGQEAADQA